MPIKRTGLYALIFNPSMALKTGPITLPKPTSTTGPRLEEEQNIIYLNTPTIDPIADQPVIVDDCTSFGCANKKWIIIGSIVGGGLTIIITALIVYFVCIRQK
jgi:hypothetical protein